MAHHQEYLAGQRQQGAEQHPGRETHEYYEPFHCLYPIELQPPRDSPAGISMRGRS